MRDQHRLRRLQVGVRRHRRVARGLGTRQHRLDPIGQQVLQRVDALAHKEAEVGRDLLVAAASGVQLVSGRANQRGELLFNEVVNVFGFGIVQKRRVGFGAAADFSQRF